MIELKKIIRKNKSRSYTSIRPKIKKYGKQDKKNLRFLLLELDRW